MERRYGAGQKRPLRVDFRALLYSSIKKQKENSKLSYLPYV
jgi:hypothetical protein